MSASVSLEPAEATRLDRLAREHLWMPFNTIRQDTAAAPPIIVGGEGCHVVDAEGRRYLDSFASICCIAAGHGRTDILDAAVERARGLPYVDIWQRPHTLAIELAARVAELAPGDLSRVFFTSGGSEAVETALKLARQYHRLRGRPEKVKVVSRNTSYHGLTFGALTATGIDAMRAPYEPLLPGGVKVSNTNTYGLPADADLGMFAEEIAERIEAEGPETVAAVILEPVQNGGGCIPPPPGYFARVREICDEHDVLLISDEVICSWGRLGTWFGAERFGYEPDLLTTAKAMTSGYAPLGGVLVSERIARCFADEQATFLHGFTFSGHPLACAMALENIDVIEREGLLDNVRAREQQLTALLESLRDIPIVGDVRGVGFFQAIEFVRDQRTRESFDGPAAIALTAAIRRSALERGVIARADVRGAPVLQVAPPLIADDAFFDELGSVLRAVLEECAAEALAA